MSRNLFSLALFLLFLGNLPAMSQPVTVKLKVIETSDIHGYFFPYDFIEGKDLKGTLTRVNTYVERQRKAFGDRLLLIDNGDILQGQPCVYWSNYVMPEDENLAASVINYMRYDAETVGNHDIETGHRVYDKWIREVRCPLLGANIIDTGNNLPYVRPYAVIEREVEGQKVRIVIIGMITPTISC
ncbi:MAG: bifunctional metallophosphatase/5'-nucleotidase, partial [Prevotella sp.]